jgi:hypothetical protein
MKKILITVVLSFFSLNSYAMDGLAQAHAYNTKGKERHNTPFHTLHKASFYNDQDFPLNINVTYKACAQFQACDERRYTITVQPHSTWSDSTTFNKVFVYGRSGKYRSSAETTITGAINRHERSEAKIEVEDA